MNVFKTMLGVSMLPVTIAADMVSIPSNIIARKDNESLLLFKATKKVLTDINNTVKKEVKEPKVAEVEVVEL